MNTEEQIKKLEGELEELRRQFYKGNFSNLQVFEKPVQLNKGMKLIVTADSTAAGAYAGRIAIEVDGAVKYLHYYNA